MLRRREAIVQFGCGLLLPGFVLGQQPKPASNSTGPRVEIPGLD